MTSAVQHYEVGEWIVHANYGVGQIKGVETKSLDGREYNFLIVEALNCKYWLPVNKTDVEHVRPLSTEENFKSALKLIKKKPDTLAKDYKARAKQIAERLSNCSLIEQARLIRDLSGRRLTKKSNVSDDDVFYRIQKRFLDEWVVATEIDRNDAEAMLEDALQVSAKKIED
jgi:RNA polymerase-interacting CarD/CdnL/TRCF family regulator